MSLIKSERVNIFNHGWVEHYSLDDYDKEFDSDKILKVVASTIYQKDSESFKDVEKLKSRLLTEGAMCTPSRVLEFIPKVFYMDTSKGSTRLFNDEVFNFLKYSRVKNISEDVSIIYTNLRNSIKNLKSFKDCTIFPINDNIEYNNFHIIKMYIPMFIRDQFMTHTQLSKLNRSYRVSSQENNQYWFPNDFEDRFKDKGFGIIDLNGVSKLFGNNDHQTIMKDLGYSKEIWTRLGTQNRYGEMIMAGWLNDPNSWDNFFLERGAIPDRWNNWVQVETKLVANTIYRLITK